MAGPGGIPFEAIDRYAERYPVDDFEAFHRLILEMEDAYMDHVHKAQKRHRHKDT